VSGQGLGDRFLVFLVGLIYALHTNGAFHSLWQSRYAFIVLFVSFALSSPPQLAYFVKQDAGWREDSQHGNYSWVPEFFGFDQGGSNETLDVIKARYPQLTTMEHPVTVRTAVLLPWILGWDWVIGIVHPRSHSLHT
jgi:hypothetical protein